MYKNYIPTFASHYKHRNLKNLLGTEHRLLANTHNTHSTNNNDKVADNKNNQKLKNYIYFKIITELCVPGPKPSKATYPNHSNISWT
jgi:hypothetical protein